MKYPISLEKSDCPGLVPFTVKSNPWGPIIIIQSQVNANIHKQISHSIFDGAKKRPVSSRRSIGR